MGIESAFAIRRLVPTGLRGRARSAVDTVLAPRLGSIRATRAHDRFALTLDDGPDPVVTPQLLDLFDELDVKCTFFLLVAQCDLFPHLAKDIAERGHEIALHGYDHRRITEFDSVASAQDYLTSARRALESHVGQDVRLYRPPYGSQSVRSFRAARKAGLDVAVWTADVADWVDRPTARVIADAREEISPGGVLLFHERLEPDPRRDAPTTSFDRREVVRQLVIDCRAEGLEPSTMGSMISAAGAELTAWFRP